LDCCCFVSLSPPSHPATLGIPKGFTGREELLLVRVLRERKPIVGLSTDERELVPTDGLLRDKSSARIDVSKQIINYRLRSDLGFLHRTLNLLINSQSDPIEIGLTGATVR
jgi:hypothetical protein